MKYNHIIWDYDGTLCDTYPVMASAFSEALREKGVQQSAESIVPFMKVSMGHAINHFSELYNLDESFVDRYVSISEQIEIEKSKPYKGIVDLCKAVCLNGGKNYLFTHRGESTYYFFDKFGLTPYFEDIVTDEQGFARKPSPDAILYLMSKHNFSSEDALMIGDRDLDILSGKNAGIHTCYFSENKNTYDEADICYSDVDELYSILNISGVLK